MGTQKKLYFGTNTKMYMTIAQTIAFLEELKARTAGISREEAELFVIPPFTTLWHARKAVAPEQIRLGAQNMGWAAEGQFSGEISPVMLREVGTEIVMIGHSERRHVLRETDEMENRKVICALEHGFVPLLCIGETAEEKAQGIADEVLRVQLKVGLRGVTAAQTGQLRVAYEPVWAIGVGGTPATKEYAAARHAGIRACLTELFGAAAQEIPLLYGGSVNPDNAEGLIGMPEIDGLFVGRSAWDAARFAAMVEAVLPVWRAKAV